MARGRTPIEKNIIVVDEQGNEYEATYPKRARGLVKHGRARFIGEHKICLACPPNMNLEEQTMSNDNTPALTMEYLLGKIDQIAHETTYLRETIAALQSMQTRPSETQYSPGDNAGEAKAQALSEVVKSRETTNQQLIALYKQMYEDLRNPPPSEELQRLGKLRQVMEVFNETSVPALPFMQELAEKILGLDDDDEDD